MADLIDSRKQCRTCGSIVLTWEAAHHLATEHPELPDPAQVRIYDLRTEAATTDHRSPTAQASPGTPRDRL